MKVRVRVAEVVYRKRFLSCNLLKGDAPQMDGWMDGWMDGLID